MAASFTADVPVTVAGRPVQFLLMSWVYAFYWFDYKWSLTNLPLENRVQFFQSHWAYFAGELALPPVLDNTEVCSKHSLFTMEV